MYALYARESEENVGRSLSQKALEVKWTVVEEVCPLSLMSSGQDKSLSLNVAVIMVLVVGQGRLSWQFGKR